MRVGYLLREAAADSHTTMYSFISDYSSTPGTVRCTVPAVSAIITQVTAKNNKQLVRTVPVQQ